MSHLAYVAGSAARTVTRLVLATAVLGVIALASIAAWLAYLVYLVAFGGFLR